MLAKQKQLLELQQKKLELELEQTKAQLVSRIVEASIAGSLFWAVLSYPGNCNTFFLMLGECAYFRTRAMQADLRYLLPKPIRITLKAQVKKREVSEGFLFLSSLQNDACL